MWNKALTIFLLMLVILIPTGCSTPAMVAAADVQRETPLINQNLLDQQVAGNNDFAFDLYQALRQEDGNLFYSPYSISFAAAMAYAGARGETEKQMSATLHYVLPQDQLHPVLNSLDQSLEPSGSAEPTFQLECCELALGAGPIPVST